MRIYPNDLEDWKSITECGLVYEVWQLNALKMNINYPFWGNYEDYMLNGGIWDSPVELNNINELWVLDTYNELINFYFDLYKDPNDGQTKLGLQMWVIHPRKGASRGVYLKEIKNEEELNIVINYLINAKNRNYQRFNKLDNGIRPISFKI